MGYASQKSLRFAIPGMLAYFAAYFYCRGCDFCSIGWPSSFDDLVKLTAVFVIGFFYEIFGIRSFFNFNESLRIKTGITRRISGAFREDRHDLAELPWPDVKDVFYQIVDSDPTLKLRSERIRFNGVLWSTAADLRAVSLISLLVFTISLVAHHLRLYQGFSVADLIIGLSIMLSVSGVSVPISRSLTKKHEGLALDQCDYMIKHKRKELTEALERAKYGNGSTLRTS